MKKFLILVMILLSSALLIAGCSERTEEPTMENTYMDISVSDANDLIATTPEIIIIDVSPEYANGHLPDAVNYPIGDGSLDEATSLLDKNKTYLVYCHTDEASMAGAQALVDAGFMNVYRLEGNYSAWVDAGYLVIKPYVDISVTEAKDLIVSTPGLIIVDVSPIYANGHIPDAVSYPLGDGSLDAAIPLLDKADTYLVYCHTDEASEAGAQALEDAGFMNVYRLEGNYSAWVDAGYAVEK